MYRHAGAKVTFRPKAHTLIHLAIHLREKQSTYPKPFVLFTYYKVISCNAHFSITLTNIFLHYCVRTSESVFVELYGVNNLNVICHPYPLALPDNMGVVSMLRRRVCDEKVNVRKAAIQALESLILLDVANFCNQVELFL